MKPKIKTLFLLAAMMTTINIQAQKIIRQTIGCMGSSIVSGEIMFRQTAGQPSNTETVSNTSGSLRQGFQQPIFNIKVQSEGLDIVDIFIFPNPVENWFNITIKGQQEKYEICITDALGKQILNADINRDEIHSFSSSNMLPGIYVVSVFSGNKKLASKKITKIN